MLSIILTSMLYVAQASPSLEPVPTIQWVAILADPPGSVPRTYLRRFTVEIGKPTLVENVDPYNYQPQMFLSVEGRHLAPPVKLEDGSTTNYNVWCLIDSRNAAIVSVAVERQGLLYVMGYHQIEIQPVRAVGCATAVVVDALFPASPPTRVAATLVVPLK